MAKEYFEKLTNLVSKLDIESLSRSPLEVKHFFSGAALYVDGTICCSWSPLGLAFKLPKDEADALIKKGKAIPLKYFEKGHVKKGYALFMNPEDSQSEKWRPYFKNAVNVNI